jgi:hypothetical protein
MARNYRVKPRKWDACSPWSVALDDYEMAACHTKEDADLIAQALNGLSTTMAVDLATTPACADA